MAKRPSNEPSNPPSNEPSKPRRSKAARSTAQPETIGRHPDVEGLEPIEDDIRRRAYERYLERGGGHGTDFEDWLEAEREVRNRGVGNRKSEVGSLKSEG